MGFYLNKIFSILSKNGKRRLPERHRQTAQAQVQGLEDQQEEEKEQEEQKARQRGRHRIDEARNFQPIRCEILDADESGEKAQGGPGEAEAEEDHGEGIEEPQGEG